ncbi:hypothetical protein CHS0354_018980, partial [Potamilus streckersoni]
MILHTFIRWVQYWIKNLPNPRKIQNSPYLLTQTRSSLGYPCPDRQISLVNKMSR